MTASKMLPDANGVAMPAKERLSPADFWHLAKVRANEGQLSALRQVVEEVILYFFYGIDPSYYQLSGFWERSTSWHSKTHHLSSAAYERRPNKLNPPNYRKLSQNELAEKGLLKILGIPSPEYPGYYDVTAGRTDEGAPLNGSEALQGYLGQHTDLENICFKPIEECSGHGFEPLEIHRENGTTTLRRLNTNKTIGIGDFCHEVLGGWYHASGSIMEELLV